jgi:hypothetical protein
LEGEELGGLALEVTHSLFGCIPWVRQTTGPDQLQGDGNETPAVYGSGEEFTTLFNLP